MHLAFVEEVNTNRCLCKASSYSFFFPFYILPPNFLCPSLTFLLPGFGLENYG